MSYYKRNSQLSLFLLISVIIVVIGVLIFYYNNDRGLIIRPSDTDNIYKFVKDCLSLETELGIRKLATLGGWLYTPPGLRYANSSMDNFVIPSEDGFLFLDNKELKYTYWLYYDDVDGTFKLRIPSFSDENDPYSIKNQLERYINENLESECLRSFAKFRDIYEIDYNPRKIDADVEFKKDNINVKLNLNIKVREKNTNKTYYYNEFEITRDNVLKEPYLHALALVYSDYNSSFVDFRVWQILTSYMSYKNRDLLPPTYAFNLKYDMRPWFVEDVKDRIKSFISAGLPYVTFYNSRDVPKNRFRAMSENDLARSLGNLYYKDYIGANNPVVRKDPKLIDLFKKDSVRLVFYPFFPIYFYLGNSLGNVVYYPKAEYLFSMFPFSWTVYNTEYEISGPVLIDIKSSSDEGGLEFIVPVEFNIRHNQPLAVEDKNVPNLPLPEDTKRTLLCNPYQFISKPVKFVIYDPVNNSGIDGGIIMFDCKGIKTCYVGETKSSYRALKSKFSGDYLTYNKSYVSLKLPINCYPGTIKVFKEGYKTLVIKDVDPNLKDEIDLGEFEMPSMKSFNASLVKIDPQIGVTKKLSSDEEAILILQLKGDPNFVKVVAFNSSKPYSLVDLLPGNYSVEGYLIYNKEFTVKGDKICYKSSALPWSKKKCEKVDPITLSNWMEGGIKIKNWELNIHEIKNFDKVEFKLLDFGVPQNFDELSNFLDELQSNLLVDAENIQYLPKLGR